MYDCKKNPIYAHIFINCYMIQNIWFVLVIYAGLGLYSVASTSLLHIGLYCSIVVPAEFNTPATEHINNAVVFVAPLTLRNATTL